MSSFVNFPTCHCHPASFDSASTPKAFVKREQELNTGFVTVTDHGTLVATRQVYDLAKKAKLTPILGLEAYFRDDACPILERAGIPKTFYPSDDSATPKQKEMAALYPNGTYREFIKYLHITMHFLDQAAYEAGIRILSDADINGEHGRDMGTNRKPIFGWRQLEELGALNVTMTTGCLGGMVQGLLKDHGRMDLAVAYYEHLRSIVKPGNFYVEIFPNDCSREWVSGVFLTMADGTELKFWPSKNLRTNVGEVSAENLAKEWGKKDKPHRILTGICNNRVWQDLPPVEILNVRNINEYLLNECRPWCPDGDIQAGLNRVMMALAEKHGDKVLIADDSHFAHPDEKIVQDVRLGGGWKFYDSYHRKSSEEAFRYFSTKCAMSQARFEAFVANSREWAGRFKNFKLTSEMSLPTKFYEGNYTKYPWYQTVPARDHSLMYTKELITRHGRMDWTNREYVERLKAEIVLLHNNGIIDLLPYFFLDEEICDVYERNGRITGPGRGSAAGLLLTYLLGITHVDPLKYELSMERFITIDRIKSGKLPDIDQDLPSRDLLVGTDENENNGWLRSRFGDHFAQISVDSTLRLKMAVRDVAKHKLGAVPDDIEMLAKKFLMPPQGVNDIDFVMGYDNDEGHTPGSIESDINLQEYVKRYPDHWEIVKKCLGLVRQKGRHACAYVVAGRPIKEFIPLTVVGGVTVTSYTAGSVEAAGGLKMDFLVVNSLKDIQDAIQLIQQRHGFDPRGKYQVLEHEEALTGWGGPRFTEKRFSLIINGKRVPCQRLVPVGDTYCDVWELPEDQKIFADVATGNTATCFQFNTPGAIQWLKHFDYKKPNGHYAIDSILGMSAFTALDRPGPLDIMVVDPSSPDKKHNMLVEYARRARGEPGSKDVLPIFDQLIPETYGVMVYQEQLQKVYQNLTGCTGAAAEEFRTNVAKKKKELVDKAYPNFIATASTKIGEENAKAAWEFFKTWGQYGFNKSHAVCYSIIGYVCAYLKNPFQLEWWASVLTNADKNKINDKFWRHAGHMIDMPDVTLSGDVFVIQGERIRAPIDLIKGIGDKAHLQICQYRPYTTIADFCAKIEQHRMATGTTAEREVLKKKSELLEGEVYKKAKKKKKVFVKGRSAISHKAIETLILAGSMDSLFPPQTPGGQSVMIIDKLQMFEEAYAKALGRKQEDVSMKFTMITPFQRFQMRKAVLPMYAEDLVGMMIETRTPGVYEVEGSRADHSRYRAGMLKWSSGNRQETIRFVNSDQLEVLNQDILSVDPIKVAVATYIDSQRAFTYQGTRQAVELVLDIEGMKFKMVKWGGRDGLAEEWTQSLSGAIAIVVLNKYSPEKPFAIEDLALVAPPLDLTEQSPEPTAATPATGEEE